jgi:hypothetical protein
LYPRLNLHQSAIARLACSAAHLSLSVRASECRRPAIPSRGQAWIRLDADRAKLGEEGRIVGLSEGRSRANAPAVGGILIELERCRNILSIADTSPPRLAYIAVIHDYSCAVCALVPRRVGVPHCSAPPLPAAGAGPQPLTSAAPIAGKSMEAAAAGLEWELHAD